MRPHQCYHLLVKILRCCADPAKSKFRAPKITILEALSATGLRSIRYAKEIPDVKWARSAFASRTHASALSLTAH